MKAQLTFLSWTSSTKPPVWSGAFLTATGRRGRRRHTRSANRTGRLHSLSPDINRRLCGSPHPLGSHNFLLSLNGQSLALPGPKTFHHLSIEPGLGKKRCTFGSADAASAVGDDEVILR